MEGMEMNKKKLFLKVLSKRHCMPQAYNEKGQGGLEYLIIIGGVILLVAVAVAVMASIGGTGTNSVNKGKGLFEDEISKAEGPKASFDANIGTGGGPAPIEVEFTDTSTTPNGTINGWEWNFGDGGTSTLQDPIHEFTQNIPYLVTLTVTDNKGGKNTAKKTIDIDFYPVAVFEWRYIASDHFMKSIDFTDKSTKTGADIVAWEWDFGDETTSSNQNPSHKYTEYAIRTVTLTVTDGAGLANSTSQQVRLGDICGNGEAKPDSLCEGEVNYADPENPFFVGCNCGAAEGCACPGGTGCCPLGSGGSGLCTAGCAGGGD